MKAALTKYNARQAWMDLRIAVGMSLERFYLKTPAPSNFIGRYIFSVFSQAKIQETAKWQSLARVLVVRQATQALFRRRESSANPPSASTPSEAGSGTAAAGIVMLLVAFVGAVTNELLSDALVK